VPDTQNRSTTSSDKSLYLNTLIGFLGFLLVFLLVALFTRIIYPRIISERSETHSELISDIIQLEVLNGCGVNGVANAYTNILRRNGFDVVETGNFDHFNLKESFVISRSGNMNNAFRIAKALGIKEENVIREESPDFYLDATVVIGADYEKLNSD